MLFLFAAVSLRASDIKVDFKKTTIESGEKETVGGFIYIKDAPAAADRSVYFSVTFPVNQIMSFTKKETYIYYPDEKKAIVISNRDEISNFNFIEPASHPVDFSAMGFRLQSLKKNGQVSSEIWDIPAANRGGLTELLVEKDMSGRLLKFEIRKKGGAILSRTGYSGYQKIGAFELPMEVDSYSAQGMSGIEDEYLLSNAVVNARLPEIIRDFRLPADTKIEKVDMK